MSKNRNHECANCDKSYDLDFQYCPYCGQKNESSVLTFKEIFGDLLGAFFSFDSKAFNSLPKLLLKPGQLTVDYLKGKRASNLSPFKMYLFFSVVLFLLLPMVVHEENIFQVNNASEANENDEEGNVFDAINDSIQTEISKKEDFSLISFNTGDSTVENSWKDATQLIEDGYSTNEAVDSFFSERGKLLKFSAHQALKINSKKGSGLVGIFLNSVSYALFLFLPLFALILKLLYARRKRFYIEHVIFALHIFSFIFFILILLTLFGIFKVVIPAWISLLLILGYLYWATLKVYQQGWLKTFFKNISLLFITSIVLIPIVFVVAILISFIFY